MGQFEMNCNMDQEEVSREIPDETKDVNDKMIRAFNETLEWCLEPTYDCRNQLLNHIDPLLENSKLSKLIRLIEAYENLISRMEKMRGIHE